MLNFRAIAVEGVGPFKRQLFKISPGITTIYGLNRTNTRTGQISNMVGKSLFFGMLPEIIHEVPVIGQKQDRQVAGTRVLWVDNGNTKNVIRRSGKKIEISVNGKDKQLTATKARTWLAENIPLTEEEISTYVYIDSRRPHPLVMGTGAQRKDFFTKFFKLDQIDQERRILKGALDELASDRRLFDELRAQYRELGRQAVADAKALTDKRDAYRAELEQVRARADKVERAQQLLLFYDQSQQQLRLCHKSALGSGTSLLHLDKAFDLHKRTAQENLAVLRNSRLWAEYLDKQARYDELLKKLSPTTLKIATSGRTQEQIAERAAKARKAQDLLADAKRTLASIDSNKPEPVARVGCPEIPKAVSRDRLETLQHRLQHARKFGSGTCPTCGQSVKTVDPKRISAEIAQQKRNLDLWEKYEAYTEYAAEAKTWTESRKAVVDKMVTYSSFLDKFRHWLTAYQELSQLPPEPSPGDLKRGIDLSTAQAIVHEDEDTTRAFEFLQSQRDKVQQLARVDIKKLRAFVNKGASLIDDVARITENLSDVSSKLELASQIDTQRAELRKKLSALQKRLVDEPKLRTLLGGYDEKAIKRMAIQSISTYLMERVNEHARKVFHEDLTFSFVWDSTNVQLLAHHKGKAPMDVRRLSGAESTLFMFILLLAMLNFVPDSRRANLLILDEPTAHMHPEVVDRFKAILPMLQRTIPCIIIITPRSDESYNADRIYTVIKKNGVASIVEGHPSTLGESRNGSASSSRTTGKPAAHKQRSAAVTRKS